MSKKNGIAEIQKELRKENGGKDEPAAVYRLINRPGKNKAVIWRTFGVVVVAADGGRTDYAACKACLTVYTFKSNTGTSSLLRHVCDQETESQKEHHNPGNTTCNKFITCKFFFELRTPHIAKCT